MKLRRLYTIFTASLLLSVSGCAEPAQAPVPEPVPSAAVTPVAAATPAAGARAEAPKQGARVATPAAPRVKSLTPKPTTPEVPFEGRRIALVHTANVIGELEPCG
jgi:hypothetical protein